MNDTAVAEVTRHLFYDRLLSLEKNSKIFFLVPQEEVISHKMRTTLDARVFTICTQWDRIRSPAPFRPSEWCMWNAARTPGRWLHRQAGEPAVSEVEQICGMQMRNV